MKVLAFDLRCGLTHGNNNKRLNETGKACRQEQRYEWSDAPTTDSSSQEIGCIQQTNHQLIRTEGYGTDQRIPNHSGFHSTIESSNAFMSICISRTRKYSFISCSFGAYFHLRLCFERVDGECDAHANGTADATSQDGDMVLARTEAYVDACCPIPNVVYGASFAAG